MDINKIIALRMERQHILSPVGKNEYDELFRLMSPAQTNYWTEPGQAPVLPLRAEFDDIEYNHKRRAKRHILKGRFQRGNVAYVDCRDLELFACAYRKEAPVLDFEDIKMLELLREEGPLNIGSIKEITGMLVKNITPILHKLQKDFYAYEDQIDNEGDRAWYVFETEFPDVDLRRYEKIAAISIILQRFLTSYVFALPEEIKSFYGFTVKEIKAALAKLVSDGIARQIDSGYILNSDYDLLKVNQSTPQKFVLLLNRNDLLAKATEYTNKISFAQKDSEILNYIMIDGIIHGAVLGKFKFGPPVIENILLDLPNQEQQSRKSEIFNAIYDEYDKSLVPAFLTAGLDFSVRES